MTASQDALLARLRTAKRAVIFTHQRPDPDALGSQAAAMLLLKHLGVTDVTPVLFAEVPGPYRFLLSDAGITPHHWTDASAQQFADVDLCLIVDTCTYNQLEPAAAFLKSKRDAVVAIDHHLSRDDVGPVILADTAAAACVEILWDLSRLAQMPMSPAFAQPLMCGLVADTGWFRFDSVKPRTHLMAADLTPHVNNSLLYEKLMQTETRPKLGLMQRALASLRFSGNDRFACMLLRQSDFSETHAAQSQTEYLVDMPLVVQSVEVVALLTQMPDGKVRGSLRSKRGVDVNVICRQFSGGGHAKAAGARFTGDLEQSYRELNAAVLQALNEPA